MKDKADSETLGLYCKVVEDEFGIELTWSERLALKHYMESFSTKAVENSEAMQPYMEGLHWFLIDHFGLDRCELGGGIYVLNKRGRITKKVGFNYIGEDSKNFKEYCRRNVQFWREERTLI